MNQESTITQENSSQEVSGSRSDVTFPEVKKKKSPPRGLIKFLLIFALLTLLAGGGYYIFSKPKLDVEKTPTPTPLKQTQEVYSTPTPEEKKIQREGVIIRILNGTGISGAAASLRSKFEDLGYEEIEVGNAKTQDYKTTKVTFDKDLGSEVRDEITQRLTEIYEEVDVDEGDLSRISVEIITGYPKGYTPTPTTKPRSTSTPTPTVGTQGTITPTPSQTPTP